MSVIFLRDSLSVKQLTNQSLISYTTAVYKFVMKSPVDVFKIQKSLYLNIFR